MKPRTIQTSTTTARSWRLGATVGPGTVQFAVWAPASSGVDVELTSGASVSFHPMERHEDGIYVAQVSDARPGDRYRYRLDGGRYFPDPCSRSQPEGVHGASEIVDPSFPWHDEGWRGISVESLIIYECHVGAYTPEGTFDALASNLSILKKLGVTAIELMPVAEFPGEHNWGYDGVDLYAPSRNYGGVAGLKRLVDAAHRAGLGVVLDVVYNHLGPDGNYLRAFSPHYFTDRYQTPWGEALNFDGPRSHWVREYVVQNAIYWLTEYHLDGLRLDATHTIYDRTSPHLIEELASRCREAVGSSREIVIMAENDANDVRLIRQHDGGGYGLDAVWADDFHHSLRVFLTGQKEGYFGDYEGTSSEIARVIEQGFVYQGQVSRRLARERGTKVTTEPASSFVFCIQNHDQVGNRPFGDRLNHLVDITTYGIASALFLTVPETPMLFMGQEFAASTPFLYFTDHHEELGKQVTTGRRAEFSYMRGFSDPEQREQVPDPQALETFLRSKLRLQERWEHWGIYRLYRDLLKLRRTDPVLSVPDRGRTRAFALGDRTVVVSRWSDAGRRLVVANFGPELRVPVSELMGLVSIEPVPRSWKVLLSTSAPRYDGVGARSGATGKEGSRSIRIPEACAVVFEIR